MIRVIVIASSIRPFAAKPGVTHSIHIGSVTIASTVVSVVRSSVSLRTVEKSLFASALRPPRKSWTKVGRNALSTATSAKTARKKLLILSPTAKRSSVRPRPNIAALRTSRARPKSREVSVPNAVAKTLRGTASARSSREISRSTTRNVNRSAPIVTRSSGARRVAAVTAAPFTSTRPLRGTTKNSVFPASRRSRIVARVPFGERSSRTSASAPVETRFDWNRSSIVPPL